MKLHDTNEGTGTVCPSSRGVLSTNDRRVHMKDDIEPLTTPTTPKQADRAYSRVAPISEGTSMARERACLQHDMSRSPEEFPVGRYSRQFSNTNSLHMRGTCRERRARQHGKLCCPIERVAGLFGDKETERFAEGALAMIDTCDGNSKARDPV